jgi:AAA domain
MAAARHEKFRFADMPEDRRLRHVLRRTLDTPDVKELQKRLARIYKVGGIGLEGDCALILGNTGAGKTTAARIFTDAKYEELRALDPTGEWERPEVAGTDLRPIVHTTSTGKTRPIVVVSVNPRPRFKSLLQDTALAMQVGLRKGFDFGEAMRDVSLAIKTQKVKMIIFDDVQHIIDSGMDAFGAADVFKLFLKSRVSVVCIGLPYAEGLGQVNKQLGRLVQQLYTMKPLRCSVGDFPELDENGRIKRKGGETMQKTTFREFMEAIDKQAGPSSVLPFDEPSHLSDPDMALRIHQATGGYVGEIMKLIQKACEIAIEDGSSRLTIQDFAQAYENRTSCSDEANWFKMKPWSKFVDRFGSRPAKVHAAATKEAEEEIEKHRKKSERRVADVMAGRK